MSTTKLNIKCYDEVEIRISAIRRSLDLEEFNKFATVGISTGACGLQTYLTPEQCEELSSMLLLAAKEVRDIMAAKVPA